MTTDSEFIAAGGSRRSRRSARRSTRRSRPRRRRRLDAERRHPRDRMRGRQQADRQSPRAQPRDLGGGEEPEAFTSRARDGGWRDTRSGEPLLGASLTQASRTRRPAPRRRAAAARLAAVLTSSRAARPVRRARGAPRQCPGQQRLDERPEARRMIELDQVRDLVRDHVFGERGRQLDQPPVEPNLALAVAAAPLACAHSTA